MPDIESLRLAFAQHGQSHVFAFWDQLDEQGRAALAGQLSKIDFDDLALLRRTFDGALAGASGSAAGVTVNGRIRGTIRRVFAFVLSTSARSSISFIFNRVDITEWRRSSGAFLR